MGLQIIELTACFLKSSHKHVFKSLNLGHGHEVAYICRIYVTSFHLHLPIFFSRVKFIQCFVFAINTHLSCISILCVNIKIPLFYV